MIAFGGPEAHADMASPGCAVRCSDSHFQADIARSCNAASQAIDFDHMIRRRAAAKCRYCGRKTGEKRETRREEKEEKGSFKNALAAAQEVCGARW